MRRITLTLLLAALAIGFYLGTPAQAAQTWGVPVTGATGCPNAANWYVNPDEATLAPVQKPEGFLFDGPSLVHHEVAGSGLDLADVTAGTFTATVSAGSAPLFKMETTNPYTTINVTAAGKFWATAMNASDTGGQSHPVDHAADLVGLPTKPGKPALTSNTKVITFGVGYGNTALVKTISFHGTTYPLSCQPVQTTSPTSSSSPSASASGSTKPPTTKPTRTSSRPAGVAAVTTTPAATGGLPVTGPSVGLVAGAGLLVLAAGAGLLLATRRRKVTFDS